MKGLVSILTPCYNGEKLISRLLDSVLKQTYPKVEMIVIDDGSKDHTLEVVNSYKDAFEKRGYILSCFRQENQGQSVAINYGLKLVKGKYLVWPDCDDFYAENDVLEQMVFALEQSDMAVGIVRILASILDENSLAVINTVGKNVENKNKTDLFEDCLFVKNDFWFCAGAYMVEMDILRRCIPNLEIYTSKAAGQNWQLMLPVLYKRLCITIEKYGYNIVARSDSHSRGMFVSLDDVLTKFKAYEDTITATLRNMSIETFEKEHLLYEVGMEYKKIRMNVYLKYSCRKEAYQLYKELYLKSPERLTLSSKIRFLIYIFPFSNAIIQLCHKISK